MDVVQISAVLCVGSLCVCVWVLVFVGFCLIDFKSVDVSHIPTEMMCPPQHSVTEKCFGCSSVLLFVKRSLK